MAKEHAMIESGRRQSLGKRIWKNRWVYLFLLPGIAFVLLFCYGPMYGLVVAFKDYKISKGILGSPRANPWYNNFAMMFKDKKFTAAFFNTIRMGLAYIITGFPGPIILALLLNELRSRHYKNTLQVIYTFPNFLSWVIVGGLMTTIFAGEGVINSLIRASGGQTYGFLTDKSLIRPLLYATSIWKETGWSAILYLAGIAGISPELYEAAEVDGANRFQCIRHITIPGLMPTYMVMLLMAIAGMLSNGMEQYLVFENPQNSATIEVLDLYVYHSGIKSGLIPLSTVVGVFKSLIGVLLLFGANGISKGVRGESII